jgi:hypothetical protein
MDLDEILYGGDDIEDDLDFMLFSPVASTISKWRTFKLLRRVHLLNRLVDLDEILYFGNGIKGDLDHSILAVCPPLITFEPLAKFSLNLVRTMQQFLIP